MWGRIAVFLWDHFWKLVSFGVTTGFIWFVASVQAPATVEARILHLEVGQQYLRDENLTLKVGLGTNNSLFQRIDQKQDRMNEALIRLSEQVSRAMK